MVFSFTVGDGEIFGFLGPSGAGKSTTQKILIGLLRDYEGRITFRDKDLRSIGRDYYQQIGVDFETPIAFSKLTALENLSFFKNLPTIPPAASAARRRRCVHRTHGHG